MHMYIFSFFKILLNNHNKNVAGSKKNLILCKWDFHFLYVEYVVFFSVSNVIILYDQWIHANDIYSVYTLANFANVNFNHHSEFSFQTSFQKICQFPIDTFFDHFVARKSNGNVSYDASQLLFRRFEFSNLTNLFFAIPWCSESIKQRWLS